MQHQSIIYFNRLTINQRKYSAYCFLILPETLYVTHGGNEESIVHIDRIIGCVDTITMDENQAIIDWHSFDTDKAKLTDQMILLGAGWFSPAGVGEINANGYVINYRLSHFLITDNNIWA